MEAKSEGLSVPRKDLYKTANQELTEVRAKGIERVDLRKLPNLRSIAKVVTPTGSARQDVEALLELLIERRHRGDASNREQLQLTFGLDRKTRKSESTDRHKAAWERHGADESGAEYSLKHYSNTITRENREGLARELCQVYDEWRVAFSKAQESAPPESQPTPAGQATTADGESETAVLAPSEVQELRPIEPSSSHPKGPPPGQGSRLLHRPPLYAFQVAAALLILTAIGFLFHALSQPTKVPNDATIGKLAAETNRLLPVGKTPVPGEASPTLGFGDEVGGRQLYPYEGRVGTITTSTPTLDSLDDVPHVGTERKFAHVLILDSAAVHKLLKHPGPRSVMLPMVGKIALVRIYVENSAAVVGPCTEPEPTIAAGVRLRAAIWNSSDYKIHVIRVWITARNTSPRWITDAIAVTTPEAARLALISTASRYWLQETGRYYPYAGANALKPAGTAIGVGGTGRIGSCWKDRQVYHLVFQPEALS